MPSTDTPDRRRQAPVERFAASQHTFDLRQAAAELAAEPSVTTQRHRQKTLYRHGRATIALFLFEAGSSMPTHTAAGAVTINVLEGRLTVKAADQQHDLPAGRLLVLASGVPHDVVAAERSIMLLQVHLDQPTNE
jgi:quercetin dioxygenase-like cupin family protein